MMTGTRNNDLTALAGKLRRQGLEEDDIFSALLIAPERLGLPEHEVRTIAKSIGKREGGLPMERIQQLAQEDPMVEFSTIRGWSIDAIAAIGGTAHEKLFFNGRTQSRVICFPMLDGEGKTVSRRIRAQTT